MPLQTLSSSTVRPFTYILHQRASILTRSLVAHFALPKVQGDPSTVEISDVKTAADITVGLYASIQQAILGFRSLPADSSIPKTFIFTGNRIPFLPRDAPWSSLFTLGLQKVDGAYLAEVFHTAYEKEGFRYAQFSPPFESGHMNWFINSFVLPGSTTATRPNLTVPPPTPIGAMRPTLPPTGTPSRGKRGVAGI